MAYEAELPYIEDYVEPSESSPAGFTPTRSGAWVTELLVKPSQILEAQAQ